MTARSLRRVAACALFSATLILISCSSTGNAPQPGTAAFFWSAARQTYAAGDYQKTVENLSNLLASDNEYASRAQPWMLILSSGMAQGYMDLAEAYDSGAHTNRALTTNFRKQVSACRGNANTLALQFAETFGKFQPKDEYVTLAFGYPTGSPTEDLLIGKVAAGTWPKEPDLEAVQTHALQRGVLLAACRAAGARNDPAKVADLLKNADAKVPRAAFLSAMASALYEEGQLYSHNKLDQPERVRIFCSRAEDALKQVPASKETQDLQKKIQAALKKAGV